MSIRSLVIFLTVFAIATSCLTGLATWLHWTKPAAETGSGRVFVVPQGSSFAEVAEKLRAQGLIRSADGLFVLAWYRKQTARIQAGEYKLYPWQTPAEILDALVQGKTLQYMVTIPEGFNMFQLAGLLEKAGLAERNAFLQAATDRELLDKLGIKALSAEGYLFPDTYRLTKDTTAGQMVRVFVDRFWEVWHAEQFHIKAREMGVGVHQAVILASIVEEEAMRPGERALIAGVFWNRLKKGMRLQADPTVRYGILVETRTNRKRLRWKDLRKETPYNTYKKKGLPAGPISNPGRESIRAVLEPSEEGYLYFVSKNNGTHHFSRTLAEHNRAVDRYQRYRRSKKELRTSGRATNVKAPPRN